MSNKLENKMKDMLADTNETKNTALISRIFFYLGILMLILSIFNVIDVSIFWCIVFMFLPTLLSLTILTTILLFFGIVQTLLYAVGFK